MNIPNATLRNLIRAIFPTRNLSEGISLTAFHSGYAHSSLQTILYNKIPPSNRLILRIAQLELSSRRYRALRHEKLRRETEEQIKLEESAANFAFEQLRSHLNRNAPVAPTPSLAKLIQKPTQSQPRASPEPTQKPPQQPAQKALQRTLQLLTTQLRPNPPRS